MIEQHIGHYKQALPYDICEKVIDKFHFFKNNGLSFGRQVDEGGSANKQDETVFLLEQDKNLLFSEHDTTLQPVLSVVWDCFANYIQDYPALHKSLNNENILYIRHIRLQKTEPGEGYHVWHYEADGVQNTRRIIAWTIFLNDVDEGGETEFLHQHKRYNASKGDILLWPSSFTHTHRGNTPLSNTKYILTGWIEY